MLYQLLINNTGHVAVSRIQNVWTRMDYKYKTNHSKIRGLNLAYLASRSGNEHLDS